MAKLNQSSQVFLDYLDTWLSGLPEMPLAELTQQPEKTAVIVVDMTVGFCVEGALASPRVASLVAPVVDFLQSVYQAGVRAIHLAQDTHAPDAKEFSAFPPHCVAGTPEAEAVPEIKALPFYADLTFHLKNSVDASAATGLPEWIEKHPEVETFVVIGDCTDICVYQMAMDLLTDANALQLARRVVVPANLVQTYDRPVSAALAQGGLPHDGDLMHAVFLYHMALNGVEVVAGIKK